MTLGIFWNKAEAKCSLEEMNLAMAVNYVFNINHMMSQNKALLLCYL